MAPDQASLDGLQNVPLAPPATLLDVLYQDDAVRVVAYSLVEALVTAVVARLLHQPGPLALLLGRVVGPRRRRRGGAAAGDGYEALARAEDEAGQLPGHPHLAVGVATVEEHPSVLLGERRRSRTRSSGVAPPRHAGTALQDRARDLRHDLRLPWHLFLQRGAEDLKVLGAELLEPGAALHRAIIGRARVVGLDLYRGAQKLHVLIVDDV